MSPHRRFFALFRRARLDHKMDDEMRAHLERETEQNIARGMSPDEAHCAARRGFGGIDGLQEKERDVRGVHWLETTVRDQRQPACVAPETRVYRGRRGLAVPRDRRRHEHAEVRSSCVSGH
jgi:hypothetical protein